MPNSKSGQPPRSADAILAGYLEQQVAKSQASCKRGATASKSAYKLPLSALDCRNLSDEHRALRQNEPSARSGSFFPRDSFGQGPTAEPALDLGSSLVQMQRKFLALFYIYVIVIISLYLTYAAYCYYQQSQLKQQQQQSEGSQAALSSLVAAGRSNDEGAPPLSGELQSLQAKLENKIQLLERYVEALAVDLEGAKWRLSEREKCACSLGCSFNGTKFADQQTWRSKCDTCKCSRGKISCQPRECPKLSCQNELGAVVQTPPGQCCPVCMKQCKVNGMLVRHGHSFKPIAARGKQCKCHDGLIKCEQARALHNNDNNNNHAQPAATNRTIEYLRSILGPKVGLPAA